MISNLDWDNCKKLLSALKAPEVACFIDTEKFISSPQFSAISSHAIEHMLKCGDSHYIRSVLEVFTRSNRFKPLLLWFCNRAGLKFSIEGERLFLYKSNAPPIKDEDLAGYLITHKGTAKSMAAASAPEKAKPRQTSHSDYIDIMDTRLILPGSYGAGKRR